MKILKHYTRGGVRFASCVLHIPDNEGNSQIEVTEEYIEKFKKFISKYDVSYYSCHGTVHDRIQNLYDKNKPMASTMIDRTGLIKEDNLPKFNWKGRIECGGRAKNRPDILIGRVPGLLPDGTIIACSNDFSLQYILGNLFEQEWFEILQSDGYKKVEEALYDENIDSICRRCHRALKREDAVEAGFNLTQDNCIRVANYLCRINAEKSDLLCKNYDNLELVKTVLSKKTICVFGLGALFWDTFEGGMWKEFLESEGHEVICSDNNCEKYKAGDIIYGMPVISPKELSAYDDLGVVIYVKEDGEIKRQLFEQGIRDVVNIGNICDLPN